jgi:hypothetical protein
MPHVANCVANAGRIESGDSYKFYAEGVTPAIDALVETVRNMTGKDFAADARALERLGLADMDGPQIGSPSAAGAASAMGFRPGQARRRPPLRRVRLDCEVATAGGVVAPAEYPTSKRPTRSD